MLCACVQVSPTKFIITRDCVSVYGLGGGVLNLSVGQSTELMEAKTITRYLPDLVTAVSDCVLSVSSKCFAEGIISESTYRAVLESGGTSEVKSNNLLLAVIRSTETDSRCFGIFLNTLREVLPYGVKDAVLSAMKKELTEQAQSMSMVVWGHNSQVAPVTLTSGEMVKKQTSVVGKLEDAIRQHERACAEKNILEENIKIKEEENKKLKSELDTLKQTDKKVNENLIASTESRISACEAEVSELRGRINKLESIIEEQDMQVKRGRNAMGIGVVNLMGQLSMLAEQEIAEVKQKSEKKEEELLATLEKKELELLAAQNEAKEKEQRISEALKEVQRHGEKEQAEYLTALRAAQEEGKKKEQQSLEALKKKDTEIQLAQKAQQQAEDELHRRIRDLEHKVALQEKDLRIKELELNYEKQMFRPKEEHKGPRSVDSEQVLHHPANHDVQRENSIASAIPPSGASEQKRGFLDWFRQKPKKQDSTNSDDQQAVIASYRISPFP